LGYATVAERDRLNALPESIPPETIYVRLWINLRRADHDKTDFRDSGIATISDGATGSNYKVTIHNLLSDVLAAIPAMRWHNYSLLQEIQFVHCAVSQ